MNVSEPFILRPVGTSLLMAAIMLSGMVAYMFLPLSTLPQVDYPTIQVQTLYPGASPEVMTSSVTAPLERQFGQMPGLNQMTSASSAGASVITLQFALDLSLDVAEQQVEEIQEIKAGTATHYLFEAQVFATREEAEEMRAQRIGSVARRFYEELPAALMGRSEPRSNLSARERASQRWKRTIH